MLFALENVTKAYGRIAALRQPSVAAPEGAVALLGPKKWCQEPILEKKGSWQLFVPDLGDLRVKPPP